MHIHLRERDLNSGFIQHILTVLRDPPFSLPEIFIFEPAPHTKIDSGILQCIHKNKDEVPNQFAADAYDVIYAMQLAANDAGITPDMSNEDISAAMSASMLNIELDGLTGKAKWTEDGECDKEPKAFEIKDGAYVEMK